MSLYVRSPGHVQDTESTLGGSGIFLTVRSASGMVSMPSWIRPYAVWNSSEPLPASSGDSASSAACAAADAALLCDMQYERDHKHAKRQMKVSRTDWSSFNECAKSGTGRHRRSKPFRLGLNGWGLVI